MARSPARAASTALALALLVGAAPSLFAIEIAVNVSPDQIDLGQAFAVQIQAQGGRLAEDTKLPDGPYDVDGPSVATQLMIINGRRSESFTYNWQVRPHEAGTCRIPAFSVKGGDGSLATTKPITVAVRGPRNDPLFFLELAAPERTVYPDQQFAIALRIFAARPSGRSSAQDPFPQDRAGRDVWPDLTLSWVEGTPGFSIVDFRGTFSKLLNQNRRGTGFRINNLKVDSGFFFDQQLAAFSLPREAVKRAGPDGTARDYYVYTLTLSYQAKEFGEHRVAPAIAKGYLLAETGGRVEPRPVYTMSNAATVRIAPPPEEGRPASFTGAIGAFTATATASPTRVRVGDPIMLEFYVEGRGDLKRIAPLKLSEQQAFEQFKVYDEPTTGEKGQGKAFVYRVRPREKTLAEIPPIEFSFFDPGAEKYVTVKTPPIPIQVEEGETLLPEAVVQKQEPPPEGQKLEETGRGIRADYRELDALRPQEPFAPGGLPLGIFGALPTVCYALLAGFVLWHRAAGADPAKRRARGASARAAGRMRAARRELAQRDAAAFYPALAEALIGFVADRLALPEHGLTAGEIRESLARAAVPGETIDELARLLDRCDAARFSPAAASGEAMDQDGAAAAQILKRLGRTL